MQETLQEIIRRISKGDQEAFRRVVEHYQRPAFTLAFRILAGELPEKQRLVFILRDIQGMDSAEVQDFLGLSETTVKSNLYYGRKTIRKKIEKILLLERRQP